MAFAELKIETELAPCCKKMLPGQCFVGHEKSDLLWLGKKIAGAAQRRNKLGLLIQGSLQPPSGAGRREDWEKAMLAVAAEQGGVHWQAGGADAALLAAAIHLGAGKFAQTDYNEKR